MIKEMAFVAYSVRDVPAARAFYRDTMGLTPGDSFGDHWAEFELGNVTFGIGNGEPLGIIPGPHPESVLPLCCLGILVGLASLSCLPRQV